MKICICCSDGGHLIEIFQIKKAYISYPHFYILSKKSCKMFNIKDNKVYFIKDPGRNPLLYINLFFKSFKIILKEKPKIIISTGAGFAIPSIILGKLIFRSKIIFIETFTRINEPSLSGKIAYYFSDLFFVQWKCLLKKYGKKAIYRGAVF
ncbi:MAG: PssD/Cps14F family polysaccharide biosynthesis glycosyltransferase [Candidatus Aenigmatarchaeota archaeon]|nr:hypothetical protein [Candidatus Aenigmarchaeota archaeon]